jgi:iron complex outermembrane receptor protein
LNLNWDHVFGAPVDLSLFGTNVTDQEYIVFNNEDLFSSMGFNSTVTGQPRMYGVRLRYNFGANAN